MKHTLFLFFAVITLLFASCTEKENIRPIEPTGNTTFVSLNDENSDGGTKYAFNGHRFEYVFHDGDRIQIGTRKYDLSVMTPSYASIEGRPMVTAYNTILPAEYVTGMYSTRNARDERPQFMVPGKMIFACYGKWDCNLYCPQRAYAWHSNTIRLTPVFMIAEYNAVLTGSYCDTNNITRLTIDSIVLITPNPCTGIAHLDNNGFAVFDGCGRRCNRLTLIPHNEESATAIFNQQEAILGYAYCPGFETMNIYWHSGHITGCKTVDYGMINTNQNGYRSILDISI